MEADAATSPRDQDLLESSEGASVHTWMNGSDWVWMSLMMVLWIAVLGAVVYIAVRLGQRPPR